MLYLCKFPLDTWKGPEVHFASWTFENMFSTIGILLLKAGPLLKVGRHPKVGWQTPKSWSTPWEDTQNVIEQAIIPHLYWSLLLQIIAPMIIAKNE